MDRALEELRPGAFAIAYRMLGSVSEAEDVVQEALLRLHRAREEGERIESPRAYLATVVTRLCDRPAALGPGAAGALRRRVAAGAAASRAEDADPARARRDGRLAVARLPRPARAPLARAARGLPAARGVRLPLRATSPAIVDTSEANARQLVARARRQVEERRPRFEASQELRDELARRFFAATEEGDLAGLEDLLAEDVVLHGDGGGKVPALARPVAGRKPGGAHAAGVGARGRRFGGATVRPVVVNGQPGAITRDSEGRLINVFALQIADGRVQALSSVVNPDKLGHLGPLTDYAALIKRRS